MAEIQLEPSWLVLLKDEFQKNYMQQLREFLRQEQHAAKVIYPANRFIFNAFHYTPLDDVKVVILGQDPYHGPSQAHGLCFSVLPGIPPPPSLRNIFAELKRDVGVPPPRHGCLIPWAQQGVLLLNAVLTVEHGKAASHQNKGWETFTDKVISLLNSEKRGIVFLLWGAYAKQKGKFIDRAKHHTLETSHPSPLSASNGFNGCGHFSETNQILTDTSRKPIQWQLPMTPLAEWQGS